MTKTRKTNDGHEEEVMQEKIQKRFKDMFSGKSQPLSNMSIQEEEALRSRLAELETKLAQQALAGGKEPVTPAREVVVQAEPPQKSNINIKHADSIEAGQKWAAVGVAGIFIAVSLAFFAFSLYNLLVTQHGQTDLSDTILMPYTFLMVIVNLTGFHLIRRDRLALAGWMLFLVNVIFLPMLTSLSTGNIYFLVTGYLIIFSLLFISLIIPKASRLKAIGAALGAALAILAIEIWDPGFRVGTNHLESFTPVVIALTVLAILAVITRQSIAGNIRIKLITTLVVVTVLSMTIVAFLADRSLRNSLTADIVENQVSLATSQGFQIGQEIISQFDKLKGLATIKTIQVGAETASLEETRPVDIGVIEQLNLAWRATVVAKNTTDPLVIKLLYNPLSTQLRNFQKTFPENVEILLTDQKGFSIAATNLPTNYYQADTLWWRTAHTTGHYIGQPTFDPATNSVDLDMAVPIFSYRNGEFVGVLRAKVNFDVLTSLLIEGFRGQTGYSIIYQPNEQQIRLQSLNDGNYEIVQDFASSDLQKFAKSSNPSMEFSLHGIPVLASSAPVRSHADTRSGEKTAGLDDLDWRVVVVQEKSEALQFVNIQTRNNLILVIIVGIVAIVIAYFLARFITNPIIHLNAVALQIASGDLTAKAEVETRDEVGELAATFNNMTSQLRSLFGSLEQRVLDRTHDLQLASEVGQTITEKIANLDELLTTAAELIRTRFDLYYTQIYLTDPSGKNITLRAGTGQVGKELLQRGHHLPIVSGSLNGRAASERRAIIVADTKDNPIFLPNSLLPKTRSEISIPLIVSGRVVGVLDMQSEQPGALNETNLPAFEALAGQLAIAIENAALFTQAEDAHDEAQAQVRRLTERGWQDFLDAIDRGQKIGYVFARSKIFRLEPVDLLTEPEDRGLSLPIMLTGATIGEIQLPVEPNRVWTTNELELIKATSAQLAQHIENLRLLAQAEHYRTESEQAVRRLTHAGWDSFQQSHAAETPGYVFDLVQVQHLPERSNGEASNIFTQPILVRGETIGELTVDNANQPAESIEILAAVSEQLSAHLENLRLSELNERHAQREQSLRQITSALRNSNNLAAIMRTAVREIGSLLGRRTIVQLVSPQPTGFMFDRRSIQPVKEHELAEELFARVPLVVPGGEVIGSLSVADDEQHPLSAQEQDFLEQVSEQLSLALESARLFEQSEQQRGQLDDALKSSRLAYWEYDIKRDRFIFNDNFYSIFHTTAQREGGYELSSADYAQRLVHPDDVPMVGAAIEKALASTDQHYTTTLEHRILFGDGGIGYISVIVHIERDETGQILRYYGANQDITERKRAEETIIAEQQRTRTILESVTIPMVITRLSDNHLTFVNSPALAITQFNYEDVINQPAPNFYANPDDRKKFVTELRAKGDVSDMVVQLRRVNGKVFWALLSAKVFEYQSETSILTTFMDITERIQAQEEMAKRATELATVAQVSTAASTMLDPEKLLQSIVDLTRERFGLYHAHIYLANESWNTLLLAAGAGETGRKLVAEQHAIPINMEQSLVARATRERRAVIVNDVAGEPGFLPNPLLPETCAEMAVPMIAGDKVLGVFDVQSNNTVGFSKEDANIYITLASQVAVALQNARLYVEQAATLTQLRELDRLKSSFLANMSHELRTPLNSILGFTDVILEGLDGPPTKYMDNDLRIIQKNGQHLLHLINDVLDMAKIESGQMNLNPEIFKVHEVLQEVMSITSTLGSEKDLPLVVEDHSDQDVKIYADRTRLRQVMLNLVNNAIKFTEKGAIMLRVCPIDGARVRISVKDTGISIAPDKLEAIFQEFTQVDASSTRKTGGTGLGLPISRRLVEMHGGRVWAESTGIPGQGSTFFVELPVEARIADVIAKQEK